MIYSNWFSSIVVLFCVSKFTILHVQLFLENCKANCYNFLSERLYKLKRNHGLNTRDLIDGTKYAEIAKLLKTFFLYLLTLFNSKYIHVPRNWLTSSDIYCIINVPYCKSIVHLRYRVTLSYCLPLHSTVLHCTPLDIMYLQERKWASISSSSILHVRSEYLSLAVYVFLIENLL